LNGKSDDDAFVKAKYKVWGKRAKVGWWSGDLGNYRRKAKQDWWDFVGIQRKVRNIWSVEFVAKENSSNLTLADQWNWQRLFSFPKLNCLRRYFFSRLIHWYNKQKCKSLARKMR